MSVYQTGPVQATKLPRPPRLLRTWVGDVLSIGVSAVVGVLPWVGAVYVPLFKPLLNVLPRSTLDLATPFVSAWMGIVAAAIQWYGLGKVSREWLHDWYGFTIKICMAGLLMFIVFNIFTVERVQYLGGNGSVSFVVGFARPDKPPCTGDVSDADCIKKLSFSESAISSFWGDRQIRLARLSLVLSYLCFMSSFGLLIGLITLKKKAGIN